MLENGNTDSPLFINLWDCYCAVLYTTITVAMFHGNLYCDLIIPILPPYAPAD